MSNVSRSFKNFISFTKIISSFQRKFKNFEPEIYLVKQLFYLFNLFSYHLAKLTQNFDFKYETIL